MGRHRNRSLSALAAGLMLAAGCASTSDGQTTSPTSQQPAAAKTANEPLVAPPDAIELSLVGDWLASSGPFVDDPEYGAITGPMSEWLQADDLTIANLECAVTADAPRRDGLDFAVRCLPEDLDRLVDAGVEAVTLANDHITDFGAAGVDDTLTALEESGLIAVGPGPDPTVIETAKGAVAVVAIPRVAAFPLTDDEAVKAVEDAAALNLPLVVSVHWGRPDARAARPADHLLAEQLVTAGADVVMGHGSGRLHAFRRIEGAAVFMGLGRFVWPTPDPTPAEADAALGFVALDDRMPTVSCLIPATIGAHGTPVFDNRDPGC